mmetsp:Transcript_8023/g.16402  ORF Transcript_8023/g.16402 Transcript_8023/m.16402 type:complete len:80 (-) Transcript_8023:28-267(-)
MAAPRSLVVSSEGHTKIKFGDLVLLVLDEASGDSVLAFCVPLFPFSPRRLQLQYGKRPLSQALGERSQVGGSGGGSACM